MKVIAPYHRQSFDPQLGQYNDYNNNDNNNDNNNNNNNNNNDNNNDDDDDDSNNNNNNNNNDNDNDGDNDDNDDDGNDVDNDDDDDDDDKNTQAAYNWPFVRRHRCISLKKETTVMRKEYTPSWNCAAHLRAVDVIEDVYFNFFLLIVTECAILQCNEYISRIE